MKKIGFILFPLFVLLLVSSSFGWIHDAYSYTTDYDGYTLYYSYQPDYWHPPCIVARYEFDEPAVYVYGLATCGKMLDVKVRYTDGQIVSVPYTALQEFFAPAGKQIEYVQWSHGNNDYSATINVSIFGFVSCSDAVDSDGDGLSNAAEYDLLTDYFNADTDDDLLTDAFEAGQGSDPNDASSGLDLVLAPETLQGGFRFNLVLADNGGIEAAGYNQYGALGDGTASQGVMSNTHPVDVVFPAGVEIVEVSARNAHALALDSEGYVWGWGGNMYGDLGFDPKGATDPVRATNDVPFRYDSTLISTFPGWEPQAIFADMPQIKRIAAGSFVNMAIAVDGTVITWGPNWHGQLGNGTRGSDCRMVTVVGLTAMDIAAGCHHSLALTPEGRVYSWGKNTRGQLGLGTKTEHEVSPMLIETDANGNVFEGVVAIDACSEQCIALKGDGTVWAWGTNVSFSGERAFTYVDSTRPKQVTGLPPVKAVRVGNNHGIALAMDGTVWSWGVYQDGAVGDAMPLYWAQVPNGTTNGPVQSAVAAPVDEIGANAIGSMALTVDDACGDLDVYAWGCNYKGELARGTYNHSSCTPQVSEFLAP